MAGGYEGRWQGSRYTMLLIICIKSRLFLAINPVKLELVGYPSQRNRNNGTGTAAARIKKYRLPGR